MIEQIQLTSGRAPGEQPLSFKPGTMTVFVGPNNSGKSTALNDIRSLLVAGYEPEFQLIAGHSVLSGLDPTPVSHDDLTAWVEGSGEYRPAARPGNDWETLKRYLEPPNLHLLPRVTANYRFSRTLFLSGSRRLATTDAGTVSSLSSPPVSALDSVYRDRAERIWLRDQFYRATGTYLCFDPTVRTQMRLCLSLVPLPRPEIEEELGGEAVRFFGDCKSLESASDGMKAFAGILCEVLAGSYPVVLIDEPEAFLHPPLARKLGQLLCIRAAQHSGNIFAATHSPEFLAGCIQSGKPVNIIRLTWGMKVGTSCLLSFSRLGSLMQQPLVRSTGFLASLFHRGAIVCESDTDRVFYAELNERLLSAAMGGADDCSFLNAQNWQTEATIMKPLREMGIPAAGILDMDVLLDADLARIFDAALIPEAQKAGLLTTRAHLKKALDRELQGLVNEPDPGKAREQRKKIVKARGSDLLLGDDRHSLDHFLADLALYGVFVVPCGEVEAWFSEFEVDGHGPNWLVPILERLGSDPSSSDYVNPSTDGPWKFLNDIARWINEPNRKGCTPLGISQ